jgi:hypothetical protein
VETRAGRLGSGCYNRGVRQEVEVQVRREAGDDNVDIDSDSELSHYIVVILEE